MTRRFGSRRSAPPKNTEADANDRAIGAILVAAGRIDRKAVDTILRARREGQASFAQAGLRLGLLTQDDIDFAHAQQFDSPHLPAGDERVSPEVVAAFQTASPVVDQLRVLRNQLMVRWWNAGPGRRALAITGSGRHEGRSFIASNLAVLFAQIGARTLLMDADLRHRCQAAQFKLEGRPGLSNILAGRADVNDVVASVTTNLSVLPAGVAPPDPHELLSRPAFANLLSSLHSRFDLMLIDTPAAHGCADTFTIATSVGAALVVARKDVTSATDLLRFARALQETGAQLLGSVLNDV